MIMDSTAESATCQPLSDCDQCVLYYISGCMARKIKAASLKSQKLQNNLVQCLATNEPKLDSHFVNKYMSWVERQDRGGLLYPIPDFYLLVREFDLIYRHTVYSEPLGSKCINQGELKLLISESAIVKLHWHEILKISQCEECTSVLALDYLMTLFITLKGFAVAKKERERLVSDW